MHDPTECLPQENLHLPVLECPLDNAHWTLPSAFVENQDMYVTIKTRKIKILLAFWQEF